MAYQIGVECNGCGFCVQWCPVRAIQGRRKQPHTIIAERCVECGACGRICGQRAVMDAEGRLQERLRLSDWPKPYWNYADCDGCGSCIAACPAHCITMGMTDGAGGQSWPVLANSRLCISCGFCQRECPQGAITLINPIYSSHSL